MVLLSLLESALPVYLLTCCRTSPADKGYNRFLKIFFLQQHIYNTETIKYRKYLNVGEQHRLRWRISIAAMGAVSVAGAGAGSGLPGAVAGVSSPVIAGVGMA